MITLYSGTPGSGKSMHLASKLYSRLSVNKKTICNFDIKTDLIKRYNPEKKAFMFIDNQHLTPQCLIQISREFYNNDDSRIREGDILLCIDECQILFSSRDWMIDKLRKSWLSFFSQHRKFGFEIILIAQFDGMIDRQIRSLIEYNCIHRKASNFGLGGKFISLFGAGKLFVSVKIWYPLNEKVGQEFFRANKKYYRIYNTFYNFLPADSDLFQSGSSSGSAAPAQAVAADPELMQDVKQDPSIIEES